MNKKYKVIAIMGKSASGKSSLEKIIAKKNPDLNKIISTTTRPIRDYEKEGIDYHFISNEEFSKRILDLQMLEAVQFNGWIYGTDEKSLDENKVNIGVYTPSGILILAEDPRIELTIIYVQCSDKIRLIRSLNREENPNCKEIIRRFTADDKDFDEDSEDMIDLEKLKIPTVTIPNDDTTDLECVCDSLAAMGVFNK